MPITTFETELNSSTAITSVTLSTMRSVGDISDNTVVREMALEALTKTINRVKTVSNQINGEQGTSRRGTGLVATLACHTMRYIACGNEAGNMTYDDIKTVILDAGQFKTKDTAKEKTRRNPTNIEGTCITSAAQFVTLVLRAPVNVNGHAAAFAIHEVEVDADKPLVPTMVGTPFGISPFDIKDKTTYWNDSTANREHLTPVTVSNIGSAYRAWIIGAGDNGVLDIPVAKSRDSGKGGANTSDYEKEGNDLYLDEDNSILALLQGGGNGLRKPGKYRNKEGKEYTAFLARKDTDLCILDPEVTTLAELCERTGGNMERLQDAINYIQEAMVVLMPEVWLEDDKNDGDLKLLVNMRHELITSQTAVRSVHAMITTMSGELPDDIQDIKEELIVATGFTPIVSLEDTL